MASHRWSPAAQDITETKTVQITAYDAATSYRLTINSKVISTAGTTDADGTATALAAAWNASTIPEVAEITASADGDTVTLTHDTEGVPFTVTSSVSGGTGTIGAVTAGTAGTGKHFWSNAANWDSGSVPTGGTNEVQEVDLASGSASGGTFTLTFSGQTTAAIDWDETAANVQAALEALSTIGTGNVSVSGTDITSTGYTVTFRNDLGYQNVAEMTIDDNNLTGSTPVGQVTTTTPGVTGDDVYFDNSSTSVKYGMSQSSVALNSLNIAASFTGDIGLSKTNADATEYVEYRGDYLQIGATTVNLGLGSGNGSGRVKINFGTIMTTVNVHQTGNPAEQDLPPVILKGTNAYNVLNVKGNSQVGLAIFGAESATLESLDVSGQGDVECGKGTTIGTVDMRGSALELGNGCTTLTQEAGTTTVLAGGITTLVCRGGHVIYNSTGTLGGNPVVSEAGILDFSQDPRSKAVTNPIEKHGSTSQILDPEGTVSNLRVDINQADASQGIVWGHNVRLTRSATS